MSDDTCGRSRLRRMRPLRTGLLAIVAGMALLAAACNGGSDSPQVASLGSSSGTPTSSGGGSGSSTTDGSHGNPTQLLNEWASCMRRHGDPGQADPTIDASKVIHFTTPPSVDWEPNGKDPNPPGMACMRYMDAASAALQVGYSPPKAPSQAALVKYAECMRANGLPDFPDPTAGGLQLPQGNPGGELDPNNPTFQNATKVCIKKTGVHITGPAGPPPPGSIDNNGGLLEPASGGNGGPGENG